MVDYFDEFEKIKSIIQSKQFGITVLKYKFFWDNLKKYNLTENLSIVSDAMCTNLTVPSYNNTYTPFICLKLSKAGDCASVLYDPPEGSLEIPIEIFVDYNNKIKSIKSFYNKNIPILDIFVGVDTIRLFHIVIPKEELGNILFQMQTVMNVNLEFLEDLI